MRGDNCFPCALWAPWPSCSPWFFRGSVRASFLSQVHYTIVYLLFLDAAVSLHCEYLSPR